MRALDIDVCCGDEVIEGLDSGKLKLWTSEASDRATACYNALAGRDPEKLEGLLTAAKALLEDSVARTQSRCASWGESYGKGTDAEEAFRAALAAFEGGGHE